MSLLKNIDRLRHMHDLINGRATGRPEKVVGRNIPKNIFIAFILLASPLNAQTYKQLITVADSLYKIKDYARSIAVYNEALILRQDNPIDLYNAACSAALAGEIERASELLFLALDAGWANFRHLKSDSDLIPLYKTESWHRLLPRIEGIEAKYNKPL
jgi:hypothetical protein